MATKETRHLESVSRLCAAFQAPYARVQRALREAGAEPELTLNGTPYYGPEAVEAAAEHIRAAREAKGR